MDGHTLVQALWTLYETSSEYVQKRSIMEIVIVVLLLHLLDNNTIDLFLNNAIPKILPDICEYDVRNVKKIV